METLLDNLRAQCCSPSFNLHAYCVMPGHTHLELVRLSANSDLIALLRDFKGVATARAGPNDPYAYTHLIDLKIIIERNWTPFEQDHARHEERRSTALLPPGACRCREPGY